MLSRKNKSIDNGDRSYYFVYAILLVILVVIIFNSIRIIRYEEDLSKKKLSGIIITLRDSKAGDYDLTVVNKMDTIFLDGISIGYEVKKYNIVVGDSLTKDKNSYNIMFYKKDSNGVYKKCCSAKF